MDKQSERAVVMVKKMLYVCVCRTRCFGICYKYRAMPKFGIAGRVFVGVP